MPTLEEIVDAAQTLVENEGYDALSMRRLARECGVGAMTLYGYVRTKEDILGALANRLLGTVELPQDGSWQDQVKALFRGVRTVFLEHPELLPIIATQRIDGLGAYRGAELVFAQLRRAGLDEHQTVHAFDALTAFTFGAAQREVGLQRGGEGLPGIRTLPADDFPHVIGLAGALMTRDPQASFEAGLDLLIGGIERWT